MSSYLRRGWSKILKRNKKLLSNRAFQKSMVGAAFFLAITALILANTLPRKYDLNVGDIVQEDIVARKDAIDTVATRKLQMAAANSVPEKYTLDQNITREVKGKVTEIFNAVRNVQSRDFSDNAAKIKTLKLMIHDGLSEDTYSVLVNMSGPDLKELETVTKAVIETVMDDGVKEESIDRAKAFIIEEFKAVSLPQPVKNAGEDIAFAVLKPNMIFDKEATQREQKAAMEAVAPVKITKGQVLVEKGKPVTAEQIELLKELGLLAKDKSSYFSMILGVILLVAILEVILIIAVYLFHRDLYENVSYLGLLALIIVSTLFIATVFKTISNFLIPLAAGSMLISILINPSLALIASFIMSIAVGVILDNDFISSLVALLGGLAGVFSTKRVSQRNDLTKAGGLVGLVNFLVILSLGLLNYSSMWDVARQSFWGITNGFLSSILTVGILPFLENAFGITTSVKLLELSNPNQPLLRRLLLEAPGTYHHSIIVGNLAEAAAEAVGGDPLLARVGASYHDIGKLKRPYFFIENQLASENPHDKLNPTLSALIITSHVKDGLDIARQYNLPPIVQDFIVQHHGTSLLTLFYKKALDSDAEKKPEENSFRYDGPKPQTKEVAIVMLADSAEAAVRSMTKPTPGKIEGLVRQIIKEKLADGQLDESNLTLKDLDKIASAFSKVLTGIFHTRIEYPEKLKELERKG
ncbi:7TM receptor with intracellular metal dependent phosphohydrolase [Thermosediminibacter oceani DSM 16646]|uniref:7TM receptor with intracellular metal dependent phosphohydrolase n=1 Tax=Thermosediminibacter oceani (strain ATCC BAA-1034 / DSM 16646 / JW/IW-1228P) TaxID=555079 RepID=D9S2Q5_THEOJ|nr:7TM receptor with intracellular metal dependent phosphohydrolase [Thermosediminibacter oceani DSM 16646]